MVVFTVISQTVSCCGYYWNCGPSLDGACGGRTIHCFLHRTSRRCGCADETGRVSRIDQLEPLPPQTLQFPEPSQSGQAMMFPDIADFVLPVPEHCKHLPFDESCVPPLVQI
jgi:hypothetical protein